MTYTVTSRREVPKTETVKGIFTGKTAIYDLTHGGKKAVCVTLASGFGAWGFAADWATAEAAAVEAARKLEVA